MPYSITTKDGITLQNIPDDLPSDHPSIKARVEKIRANESMGPVKQPDGNTPPQLDAAAGGSTLKFGPMDTGIPLSEDVNNFLAGAGQNIMGLARGASQVLPGGATREDISEQRRLDADLNKRSAATAGNLLSNLPLAFIPGAGTTRGAAALGGALGFLQPSVSTTETFGNAALGAGGGAVGQMFGNRMAQLFGGRAVVAPTRNTSNQSINVGPSSSSGSASVTATPQVSARTSQFIPVGDDISAGLTTAQEAALAAGQRLGMRTTPGQATGSKVLQQLEAKLESQPASSGTFFDIKSNNARTLNRAVAAEMGEQADDISSDVLDRAYTRMGGVFDSVADDLPRQVDPDQFLARLAQVEADNEGMLSQGLIDNPLVQRYFRLAASGEPTGAQLNNLQSQLGKAAQSKRMTDPAQAQALREVQNLILDDIGNGLAPEARAAFQEARRQYRVFSMVADKPNILNPSTGAVSGPNLASTLQRTDRTGFALGRNESPMYDAARFAQAFKPLVGDSGTATRSPLNTFELAASVPINLATRAYASTPSINVANAMSTVMRNGVAPNYMSPTNANALRQLMGAGGALAGTGATPLIFGNSGQ
jgi:hypothetical protein